MLGPPLVGSLFSGIGAFDLGLERAGMRVVWQCESDEFCQRVLAKHWPAVPRYPDVRSLRGDVVAEVDVLCGGFPCQDLSWAGPGAGLGGARSGLWSEYARLVGELRPRYVIVENVSALLARGMGVVLGDLAALGYDAEWDCIPAASLGAPHLRDRVWIIAYPSGSGLEGSWEQDFLPAAVTRRGADARPANRWAVEPEPPRVDDGSPDWVDRVRTTGNALVPQIAERLGRRVVADAQLARRRS